MTASNSEDHVPLAQAVDQHAAEPPACWTNGPFLVVRTDAELPPRCVKCNRPAGVRVRKRVYWSDADSNPAGGVLRFVPVVKVFFAIQSMFRWFGSLRTFRCPAVEIPLCSRHALTCRVQTLLAYTAFPLSLCVPFAQLDMIWRIWVPVIGFSVSAILWARPRPVKAVHVGMGHVTLSGAGLAFLRSVALPTRAGMRPGSIETVVSAAQALRERLAGSRGGAQQSSGDASTPAVPKGED